MSVSALPFIVTLSAATPRVYCAVLIQRDAVEVPATDLRYCNKLEALD